MTVKKLFCSIFIISACSFFLLTGLVIKDQTRKIDFDLTVKLQDKISKRFDDELVMVVDLGSMEIQTTVIALVILSAPVSKKFKTLLAIAYIIGLCITLLGKNFLPQPAPPFFLQRGSIGFFFPSNHVQVDASYPSGHTYRTIFLASLITCLTFLVKKLNSIHIFLVTVIITITSLVLLGLILLGKHWTSDVLGGIFLGMMLVCGCFVFQSIWRGNSRA